MDVHYLGEFSSLKDVWKLFPNGGGYGDYVTILGVRNDWNEFTNSWGEDPGDVPPALPEVVNHDIDVQGTGTFRDGIKTADYIPGAAGAFIDHAGNADLRSVRIDTLQVKDPITGVLLNLPDFIKIYKTELPPDWIDYSQVPLFDTIRILAFDPLTEEKYYTTVGALKKVISDSIAAGSPPGGTFEIEILRSDSTLDVPTDSNVFSSLRTLLEIQTAIAAVIGQYLSRVHDDSAEGLITFLKGLKLGNFIPGLLGSGGRIDEYGRGELRSLKLWESLEVPELRFNRISVYTGVQWQTFGGGIIESVEIDKDEYGQELQSGIITLKLEEGEYGAVAVDDMCQGIYHNFGGANDTVSEDQRNGNFHIQGFRTSYFRITEILDTATNGQFRYVLRGTSERWNQLNHPSPYMHFACYANPSNTDRQACSYSTTEYSIRLHNMTTWEYGENNIYAIDGKLDGFKLGETVFTGTGQVIGNGYFYGYIQNIVNAPLELRIENDGDNFLAFGESMDIICKVFKGLNEITSLIEEWSVTRESGNQTEDDAWNIAHQNFAGQITLQHGPSYSDLGDGISTLFRFMASGNNDTAILEFSVW